MKVIIIHYQVIQDAKKCSNITIRKKKFKPKDRSGLQKEPNIPNGEARPSLLKKKTHTPKE